MTKKIIILLVLTFFLAQGIAFSAGDEIPKKVLKLEKKGDKALKKNELDKALEYYNEALKLYSEYDQIHCKIASVFTAQKNDIKALKHLEKALEINPENSMAAKTLIQKCFILASEQLRQNKIDKANEYYLKLIGVANAENLGKDFYSQSLYQLGLDYFSKKEHKKSNEYLLKFVKIPGVETDFAKFFSISHYLIGMNFAQLQDFKKSDECLLKFLEMNKEDSSSQIVAIANFIIGSNNFELLEKEAKKIEEDASIKKVRDKKLKIAELAKEKKTIEPYLKKAIEIKPDIEDAYKYLGNYYMRCQMKEEALKVYKLLNEKFPNSPQVLVYKKIVEDIEKIISKEKKDK